MGGSAGSAGSSPVWDGRRLDGAGSSPSSRRRHRATLKLGNVRKQVSQHLPGPPRREPTRFGLGPAPACVMMPSAIPNTIPEPFSLPTSTWAVRREAATSTSNHDLARLWISFLNRRPRPCRRGQRRRHRASRLLCCTERKSVIPLPLGPIAIVFSSSPTGTSSFGPSSSSSFGF